jgi:hypothetical protein
MKKPESNILNRTFVITAGILSPFSPATISICNTNIKEKTGRCYALKHVLNRANTNKFPSLAVTPSVNRLCQLERRREQMSKSLADKHLIIHCS